MLSVAPDGLEHNIKNERKVISQPRFNFSANLKPAFIRQLFLDAKLSSNDTCISSMILFVPPSLVCYAEDIRIAASEPSLQMHSILLLIDTIHKSKRTYSLSPAATKIFEEQFNLFSSKIEIINKIDSFLA